MIQKYIIHMHKFVPPFYQVITNDIYNDNDKYTTDLMWDASCMKENHL